jgi:hypothetical protein
MSTQLLVDVVGVSFPATVPGYHAGRQPRHELARDGVALDMIQRQLGHADLGVAGAHLQGIDSAETIKATAPVTPSAGLRR